MNGRVAKKIRRAAKRSFFEYLAAVKSWPFTARWRLCWYILFGKRR